MNVLYSTGCPKCKVLEEKLKRNDIPFELVEGEEAEKAIRNLGHQTAPVFVCNKESMSFTSAIRWINGRMYIK